MVLYSLPQTQKPEFHETPGQFTSYLTGAATRSHACMPGRTSISRSCVYSLRHQRFEEDGINEHVEG